MTISLRAAGAATAATAAVSPLAPGAPAGLTATDISILVVEAKNATAGTAVTITTPTGWTPIGSVTNNGTLAPSNDAGSNAVGMYYRVGTYTAPSITTTGANSAGAGIVAYATSTGGTWDVSQTTVGSDTTSAANGSITGAADIGLATGDWAIVGTGLSGDLGSVTAESLTVTGATLGAYSSRINQAVTTGNDSRLLISDWPVTAGTSTAAPAYTWTNNSSLTGHARILRLREIVVAPSTAPTVTTPNSNQSTIRVSWTTVTGATSYDVERAGVTIATGVTASPYDDNNRAASTTYAYRVRGVNSAGAGPWSSSVNGTTTAVVTMTRQNSFELAPAGTAIPVGSTGDGDAFEVGATPAGSSIVSANDVPAAVASGSLAAKITLAAGGAAIHRGWNWTSPICYARFYTYVLSNPDAHLDFVLIRNIDGTTISRIQISTLGRFQVTNGLTGSMISTGPASIPLNQLVRGEVYWNLAAGTVEGALYSGHSTTPITDTTISATGQTWNTQLVEQIRFGQGQVGAGGTTYYMDAIAASTNGPIGPVAMPTDRVFTRVGGVWTNAAKVRTGGTWTSNVKRRSGGAWA